MKKFIYVLKEKDKNLLIKHGYELAKENRDGQIWVFHNKEPDEDGKACFEAIRPKLEGNFALSDIISL